MSGYSNHQQWGDTTPYVFSNVNSNHPGVSSIMVDGSNGQPTHSQSGYGVPGHSLYPNYSSGMGYTQGPLAQSQSFSVSMPVLSSSYSNNSQTPFAGGIFPQNHTGMSSVYVQSPQYPINPMSTTSPMSTTQFFGTQTPSQTSPLGYQHFFAQQNPQMNQMSQTSQTGNSAEWQQQQWQQQQQYAQQQQDQQQKQQQPQYSQQQQQQHLQQQQQYLQQQQQANQPKTSASTTSVSSSVSQDFDESHHKWYQTTFSRLENKSPRRKDIPNPSAPPHSYRSNPGNLRQNTLPGSLPTSLNPSLLLDWKAQHPPVLSQTSSVQSPISPRSGIGQGSSESAHQDDQTTSGMGSSVSSSVSGSCPTSPNDGGTELHWGDNVVPCYERPPMKDTCRRCLKKVYPMERIGPIKGVVYHKNCFTCAACGTLLNLKNFHHNPNDLDDINVYCLSHKPKGKTMAYDSSAVHIKSALTVPRLEKINQQIRGDRHPSQVLARVTSGSKYPQQEQIYYGMGSVSQDEHQQQQQQQQVYHQQLQQQMQQQLQQERQQMQDQMYQEQQMLQQQHRQQQQEEQQQQEDQKLTHNCNDSVPQTNVDSSQDNKNNYSESRVAKTRSSQVTQTDDVFYNNSHGTDSMKSVSSTASSVSSSSPSPSSSSKSRCATTSIDSVTDDISSRLSFDSDHDQHQGQQHTSTSKGKPQLIRSDRPSNESSRSSSPVRHVDKTKSRPSYENGSIRSSTSSNISNRDSAELNERRVSTTSSQRSDRPSSSCSLQEPALTVPKDTHDEKGLMKSNSDHDFDRKKLGQDPSCMLPRNEIRRMDRPSQYS